MPDAVLRFAPSPTGGFHIGNARTALYNYLYARHYGATLLLRVEDTDRERYTDASLQTILDGLDWLGITFAGQPVFQSQNVQNHRQAVDQLLRDGHAYYAYETPEELEAMRKQALAEKRRVQYTRSLTPEQQAAFEAEGRPRVVRFKVPEGETTWDDLVRGVLRWDNREIEDFVILRADGTPVYQLAVVVDDHDMGVTLALRGADHLSNTPKQVLLFRALGWPVPQYGHSTLILGPDGKKLSKRHGATTVTEYQEQGYLPETVVNYLALLGWAPGDGREFFTPEELIHAFSVEGLLRRDTVFDEKKLEWLNGEHLRSMPVERLARRVASLWVQQGWISEAEARSRQDEWVQTVALMRERVRTLRDFLDVKYFFCDPETYDEQAVKKNWKTETPARMEALVSRLEGLDGFGHEDVEGALRTLAGEMEVSASRLIHPTRLALSGVPYGPGLFELMAVLGKKTCLRRLRKALEVLGE